MTGDSSAVTGTAGLQGLVDTLAGLLGGRH
jgi:hypothetical protein